MKHQEHFIIFGENVRNTRDALGYSQEKLALEAGMERRHLQRIEQGTANPSYGKMLAIADALGESVVTLQLPILN